ncbi:HAD family hydrolase [Streptomyces sp. NBC_01244]|uniref:HAD family hydrolase n=1 Tax=Streptomyces sp. NBC_01244 TaxID=2903797 RepID=UPI002E0D783D|nr:haloacid dehalogenase-like hydrolase [Streptomyces sp. NBC_01244]
MSHPVLPSWRDGETRTALLRFVEAVTTAGEHFLEPPDRVAVFDNDGTLWPERPMPVQLHYLTERWRQMAQADPALADREPYASVLAGDPAWIASVVADHYAGDDTRLPVLAEAVIATQRGLDTDAVAMMMREFFRTTRHPVLRRPYPACAYQPMLELLAYLRDREFATVIVSGGGRDFMRVIAAEVYGVRPEQVIGSTADASWSDTQRTVVYGDAIRVLDDGPEKPVQIWSRLGRHPVLACGNSNGDIEMLTYAASAPHGLALLIHHDDGTRDDIPYDAGAERALAEAERQAWLTVSVREDWARVYPDAP